MRVLSVMVELLFLIIKKHFQSKYNVMDIEVIGLYLGARGTISKNFIDFLKRFKIPVSIVEPVVSVILKISSLMCNQHLYS